jgi:hypothetical protein
MKNTIDFRSFRNKRKGINESVIALDDMYKVRTSIEVPASLVNAYIKKVKDESGKNIRQMYSDMDLAEEIANYIASNFMAIENIPVSIVMGTESKAVQAQSQPQAQAQGGLQAQLGIQPQAQPGAQPQAQPGAQPPMPQAQPGAQPPMPQAPMPQGGAQAPARTAQQIPPQEI